MPARTSPHAKPLFAPYQPPATVAAVCRQGGTLFGFSAISLYLSCPERFRLERGGVRQRPTGSVVGIAPLDRLGFGSLMHAVLATRVSYGQEWAEHLLNVQYAPELHPDDRIKALTMIRIYDSLYPRELEPFEIVAVEAEVWTELQPDLWRTVRYDVVVRPFTEDPVTGVRVPGPEVFSLEHKTSARGGQGATTSYMGQFLSQVAIWNANPALVEHYGKMGGVVPDVLVKTIVPSCERSGPFYFSELQQRRMLAYLQLPEQLGYLPMSDGTMPRMFHSCWARFGPCPYIDLCHDDAVGNYIWPEAA